MASGPSVLALSARSESALRVLAGRVGERLEREPGLALADVCYTAGVGRAQFAHRLAFVTDSTTDAANAWPPSPPATKPPPTSRWAELGGRGWRSCLRVRGRSIGGWRRGCIGRSRCFGRRLIGVRGWLIRCWGVGWPRLVFGDWRVMAADEADDVLGQTRFTQPALFAVEFALAELWLSWGVRPQAVVGHSLGEYVAAVVAGVFSVEDGLRLVVERARLMGELPAGGAMTAIFAPVAEVEAALVGVADRVSVAAVNGVGHTVISGVGGVVDEVAASFAAAGVRVQPLRVSHAFHSPLIEPMVDDVRGGVVDGDVQCSAVAVDLQRHRAGRRCRDHRTRLLAPTHPPTRPIRTGAAEPGGR